MSYESDNPFAVVEVAREHVVARYDTLEAAEFHIANLRDHGGDWLRQKVLRGGYRIDGPQDIDWEAVLNPEGRK